MSAHVRRSTLLDVYGKAQGPADQSHGHVSDPSNQPDEEALSPGVLGQVPRLTEGNFPARNSGHASIVIGSLRRTARRTRPSVTVHPVYELQSYCLTCSFNLALSAQT